MNKISSDLRLNPIIGENKFLSPIITNIYDMLLQEIDILFSTDQTEILNGGTNWANLRDYVFKTSISNNTLSNKLKNFIYEECPSAEGMNIEVDVNFIRGTLNDMCVVTVVVKDNDVIKSTKDYFIG